MGQPLFAMAKEGKEAEDRVAGVQTEEGAGRGIASVGVHFPA
jgi:hypothetical protein